MKKFIEIYRFPIFLILMVAGTILTLSYLMDSGTEHQLKESKSNWKHWRNIHANGMIASCYESTNILICIISKPTWPGPKTVICDAYGCSVR